MIDEIEFRGQDLGGTPAAGRGLVMIRSSSNPRPTAARPRPICPIRRSPLGVSGRSSSGMPIVP